MPEAEGAPHLLDYFLEVGPARGGEALSYQEIESWSRLTSTPLTPWEAATLQDMSETFVVGLHKFRDKNAAPPWTEKAPDQAKIAQGVERFLMGLNQNVIRGKGKAVGHRKLKVDS